MKSPVWTTRFCSHPYFRPNKSKVHFFAWLILFVSSLALPRALDAQNFVIGNQPAVTLPGNSDYFPDYIAALDVNHDGKLDLVSANSSGGTLSVLTNDGAGNFQLSHLLDNGAGSASYYIAVADVNGDGNPDLISANYATSAGSFTVLTNNGAGNFASAGIYAAGQISTCVAAADINGDGKIDLISADPLGNQLVIYTNNGNGQFTLKTTQAFTTNNWAPAFVVAADVNGDGKMDLVTANYNDNSVAVLTNDGHGNFTVSGVYPVGISPNCITAADVNGDGKMDFITADLNGYTMTVLTNNGAGGLAPSQTLYADNNPLYVVAADFNGDNHVDLAVANYANSSLASANDVMVFTNDGTGNFALNTTLFNSRLQIASDGPPNGNGFPNAVAAGDVNGDGRMDLISVINGSDDLTVYLNFSTGPQLAWQGGVDANWDVTTANWADNAGQVDFTNGYPALFNDSAIQTNIFIPLPIYPGNITVSNNLAEYTFSGGEIGGNGTLIKSGTGTLTLSNENAYAGGTIINQGTLLVATPGNGQTGLGAGNVTVNPGGTLIGGLGDSFGINNNPANVAPALILINDGVVTDLGTASYRITLPNLTFNGGTLTSAPGNNGDANGNYSLFGTGNPVVTSLASSNTAVISAGAVGIQNPVAFNIAAGNVTGGATPGVDLLVSSALINFNSSLCPVTKTGMGVLAFSATNSYTGDTLIASGTLALDGNGAIAGSTNIVIASGARFDVSGLNSTCKLNASQTLQSAGGTIAGNFNPGTNDLILIASNGVVPLTITNGILTLNNNPVTLEGISLTNGTYKLIAKSTGGSVGGSVSTSALTLNGINNSLTPSLAISNNELILTVVTTPMIWQGNVNTNWDISTTKNWLYKGAATTYTNNFLVQFDDTALQTNVFVTAPVSPAGILVSNNSDNFSFGGNAISGAGGLLKTGAGSLALNGTNTFSGGITINGGTVLASGFTGGKTSLGYGNVTINAGGTLVAASVADAFGFGGNAPLNLSVNGGTVTDAVGLGNYHTTLPNLTFAGGMLTSAAGNAGDSSGNYSIGGNYASVSVSTLPGTNTAVISAGVMTVEQALSFNIAAGSVTGGATPGVDLLITSRLANYPFGIFPVTKIGAGTLQLTGTNTFTGTMTISNGTLALSGTAALAATNISLAGGATFDVSNLGSTFQLNAGQSFAAIGGTGIINGNFNAQTNNLVLTYAGGIPALAISHGTLTLNNNPVTVTGANSLPPGVYPLIAKGAGGSVNGSVTTSALAIGTANAKLQINNGELDLVANYSPTNPPPLTATFTGNQLTISWPSWVTGFTLQTNGVLTTANWGNYNGTVSSSNTAAILPNASQLFFRLH